MDGRACSDPGDRLRQKLLEAATRRGHVLPPVRVADRRRRPCRPPRRTSRCRCGRGPLPRLPAPRRRRYFPAVPRNPRPTLDDLRPAPLNWLFKLLDPSVWFVALAAGVVLTLDGCLHRSDQPLALARFCSVRWGPTPPCAVRLAGFAAGPRAPAGAAGSVRHQRDGGRTDGTAGVRAALPDAPAAASSLTWGEPLLRQRTRTTRTGTAGVRRCAPGETANGDTVSDFLVAGYRDVGAPPGPLKWLPDADVHQIRVTGRPGRRGLGGRLQSPTPAASGSRSAR